MDEVLNVALYPAKPIQKKTRAKRKSTKPVEVKTVIGK
jgi:hypothetical protein